MTRKEFEEFLAAEPHKKDFTRISDSGRYAMPYRDPAVQLAWEVLDETWRRENGETTGRNTMTTSLTESQFRALVEQFVKEQGSQTKAARIIGVSTLRLRECLAGKREAGWKLAAHFGLVPEVRYVKREKNKE